MDESDAHADAFRREAKNGEIESDHPDELRVAPTRSYHKQQVC